MAEKTYSKEFLIEIYRKMVLIRQFEERVKFLFLEGIMPGTIHQYQGQEACAVGVCLLYWINGLPVSAAGPISGSIGMLPRNGTLNSSDI